MSYDFLRNLHTALSFTAMSCVLYTLGDTDIGIINTTGLVIVLVIMPINMFFLFRKLNEKYK